jgi:hypothetical protein
MDAWQETSHRRVLGRFAYRDVWVWSQHPVAAQEAAFTVYKILGQVNNQFTEICRLGERYWLLAVMRRICTGPTPKFSSYPH